ncbi:diacylglyceryl transferase [Sorangium cellulosum]|uniref:Diacylglyceryl transferase n=1 Tax=Sorangium cellulosum TaxID=56 RepID=A0A4P2PXZ4_SORCE|nr:prolipoprotein diacylglyceryl transferase family protein [Sorangium cellulosum]AUX21640.1 diacylglyceryl transferase [Sorangium cellulosum]
MSGPLIPYIQLPEIPLSFLEHIPLLGQLIDPAKPPSIKPFGALVALGVYIGSVVATRHARERRLDEKKMSEFIFWVVAAGFIGGHVFDALFYHPQRVARDPLYLFALWDGLSSFGGFTGALLGAAAWRYTRREKILPYCEVVNSAFPLAWVFGRAGCASVHDHPGHVSDAWFAVRYPLGDGIIGRYDLGLYECVLTIPLAIAFAVLWRRNPYRPLGFYTGVMCTAYAPVRFGLDFLRERQGTVLGGDPRYGGLTPAQWACIGLLALGLYFLRMAARGEPSSAGVGSLGGASRVADDDDPSEDDGAEADEAEEPRARRARADR